MSVDTMQQLVALRAELREVRALALRSRTLALRNATARDGRDAEIDWSTITAKIYQVTEDIVGSIRHPKDGEKGDPGKRGEPGPRGTQGQEGPRGPIGPMPEHKWTGTALAFENPDGTFDKPVDLQGPKGDQGYAGAVGVLPGSNFFSYQPAGFL